MLKTTTIIKSFLFLIIVFFVWFAYEYFQDVDLADNRISIIIRPGDSFQSVSNQLIDSGVVESPSGTYTANTWASQTQANRAVGITSFFDSTDRTFFLTGVQLEVGSQATPFEHRSFGEELALCQRYLFRTPDGGDSGISAAYQFLGNGYIHNSTTFLGQLVFPKTMRVAPTCSFAGEVQVLDTTGNRDPGSNIALDHPTSRSVQLTMTISGATAGQGAIFRLVNDSDGYIQADSEL